MASSSADPPSIWRVGVVLSLLSLVIWAGLARSRPGLETVWGDEGTYLAMIASLAEDGDLLFGPEDRARIPDDPSDGRSALILQRTDEGLSYSKPVLYALWAAPFYFVLGSFGPVAANGVALLLALWAAWPTLRRRQDPSAAFWLLAAWALGGAFLPYLLWRMSESLQVALALAGMALALPRGDEQRRASLVGAFLLGLLAVIRYPNAVLAVVPVAAAFLAGRRGHALRLALAAVLGAAVLLGLGAALTGTPSPYQAERASFDTRSGYPETVDHSRFETVPATHAGRPFEAVTSAYASFYFLVGRHSGLLVYLPVLALLIAATLRRPDREGLLIVAAAAVLVGFYLLFMPRNYFGGSTFVGNRYVLPIYAAMLVAPARLPSRRSLAGVWVWALVVGASALVSTVRAAGVDSQSHTRAGVFRYLPYESTARDIDGRRDRYWSGDFVRFTEPTAEVEPWSFVLPADGRGTELLIATRRERGTLRFQVTGEGGSAGMELRDWLRKRSVAIDGLAPGEASIVGLRPSPAWRHHPFWWASDPRYRVWVLRLAATGGDLRVRYLGDGSGLEEGFAREVLEAELVQDGITGGSARVVLRVVNRSEATWSSESVLPTVLGWRLFAADGRPLVERQLPLVGDILPGQVLEQSFEVPWPELEGEVRLEVDLVRDQVARFASRCEGPLASWPVVLGRAAAPALP